MFVMLGKWYRKGTNNPDSESYTLALTAGAKLNYEGRSST